MENTLAGVAIEIDFYESLYAKHPKDWEVVKVLADAYMRSGFIHKALTLDEKLASQFPEDPLIHYNYACSLCRNHQLEAALEALQKAISLGYSDWDFLLKDKDLFPLRQTQEFLKWAQVSLPGADIRKFFK